jgi:hypothetical protein
VPRRRANIHKKNRGFSPYRSGSAPAVIDRIGTTTIRQDKKLRTDRRSLRGSFHRASNPKPTNSCGFIKQNGFHTRHRSWRGSCSLSCTSQLFVSARVHFANVLLQGRAGLVAWRRSRGGVGALGQAFFKGGFEQRMNRREASLILSLKYATFSFRAMVVYR